MRVLDNKGNLLPLLLAIGLSSINFIFPSNKINKKLCDSKEEDYLIHSYDEMRLQFPVEYDRANPITRDIAMKEYLEFIKSNWPASPSARTISLFVYNSLCICSFSGAAPAVWPCNTRR